MCFVLFVIASNHQNWHCRFAFWPVQHRHKSWKIENLKLLKLASCEENIEKMKKLQIVCRSFRRSCFYQYVSISNVCTIIVVLAFATCLADAFERDFVVKESLSDSIRSMLNDGFSQQEIVNTIKAELGLNRMKSLFGKLYDGDELTDEEVAKIKSGEVEDNDEELTSILEDMGVRKTMILPNNVNNETEKTNRSRVNLLWLDREAKQVVLHKENCDKVEKEKEAETVNTHRGSENQPLLKPDYAYSPYDLVLLVNAEESIYHPLKKYINKMEAKLQILKSYTEDYEKNVPVVTKSHGLKPGGRALEIASNPLTSFKMIKRFAFKLPEVWNVIAQDFEEELWNDMSQVRMKYQPPNEQDWKESIESLLRIQYYSGYSAEKFSYGFLGSITSNVKLTSEDCLEIGLRALAINFFDLAVEWLHLARKKHTSYEDESIVDSDFLKQSLEYAIKQHNEAWSAQTPVGVKSHVFSEKIVNQWDIDKAVKKSTFFKELSKKFRHQEEYDYPIPYNFLSLCSGENLQTEFEKSRLRCWFERSKHPYFYINPMKIELLNEDPYLIQVYDVIGDKLIDLLKSVAISKLQRSQVVNYNDPNSDDISLVRTSSQTWIPSWSLELAGLKNLPQLIEKITGLTSRKYGSSEDFQVACYGTSHHYDEHLDAVQDARRTVQFGERIATFMLYLSTVEEGGKTAFPVMGVAAKPVKGSAVFWYNLKKNGEPDKRTWHGGCPVNYGIKWVMNNWILHHENIHNRPCSLVSNE